MKGEWSLLIEGFIFVIALIFIATVVYPFMESLGNSVSTYLNLKAENQSDDIIQLILRCNELEQRIKDLEDIHR